MYGEAIRYVTSSAPTTVVTELLPTLFPREQDGILTLRISTAEGTLEVRFTRHDIAHEVARQLGDLLKVADHEGSTCSLVQSSLVATVTL